MKIKGMAIQYRTELYLIFLVIHRASMKNFRALEIGDEFIHG